MELDELIEVLEKSIEKHGESQLTNTWLLNILKVVQRNLEDYDEIPF